MGYYYEVQGVERLTYSELQAWAQLTHRQLRAWEVHALLTLDSVVRSVIEG